MVSDRIDSWRVPPEQLYVRCDPATLPFETTANVAPVDGTVGQERALHSVEFGLEIEADDYNLFIAGPGGTGRNSTLRAVVRRVAAARPAAPDWCYIYNFGDRRQPSVISLPAGRGHALASDMDSFIEACRREIARAFDSEAYGQRRDELTREFQTERDRMFAQVEEEARKRGYTVTVTPMGVTTVPLKPDGQPMSREEFAQLAEDARREIQARGEELQSTIAQALAQTRRVEKEVEGRLAELDKTVALYAVTPLLNELRQNYMDIPRTLDYLQQVETDIVANLGMFRGAEPEAGPAALMRPPADDFFARYKVNVIVAQEDGAGAPVVIENSPTYYALFGRVEYRSQLGSFTTDHTMVKGGALHRANGGYLILQALDVLTNPLVWETLKRTLRCREIQIENLGEQFSAMPVTTLSPEPIPLHVKVVLVGSPRVYQLLFASDEDFRKLFRAKADFATDMARTSEGLSLYAAFISNRVRDESLHHLDRSAIARVIEYGSRLVEKQDRLSTRFIDIADLVTESDFWAARAGSDVVRAEHVEQAIEEKVYRSNLIEERLQDMINDGTIFIDSANAVAGQVNGLSVFDLGEYRFGRPSRITARVSIGRGQVVSIEREINMSGRIHNKGFAILNGYLQGKYAQERALSLSASIGFEQVYNEVDGDSASAAELYALLSALTELPIKQGIAVTGSVNQRGEVQPIGGANEKIEGFFAVCKAQGFTGEQGVCIPRTNVQTLMLKHEVVDAVRAGTFHIWAVSTVDEGIEVLTGTPAGEPDTRGRYAPGTVNRLVTDRLARMSRRLAASGGRPRKRDDKGNGHEQKDLPPA